MGKFCLKHRSSAFSQRVRDLLFEIIDLRPKQRALIGRSIAQVLHQILDRAFFTKVFDLELFYIFARLEPPQVQTEIVCEATVNRSCTKTSRKIWPHPIKRMRRDIKF